MIISCRIRCGNAGSKEEKRREEKKKKQTTTCERCWCGKRLRAKSSRPVRLAYEPPASSTFLSEQTSQEQPASSSFLSEQISISHQPNEQAEHQNIRHPV
jgi:hypothetical protein